MTVAFEMQAPWRERLAQVVHVNGTCRPQVVEAGRTPALHALLEAFHARTGLPALMNNLAQRAG